MRGKVYSCFFAWENGLNPNRFTIPLPYNEGILIYQGFSPLLGLYRSGTYGLFLGFGDGLGANVIWGKLVKLFRGVPTYFFRYMGIYIRCCLMF